MYAEVKDVEQLSPNMMRVVLGGRKLENFTSTDFTDQYIKAYFIPSGAPYSVPFDLEEARMTGDVREIRKHLINDRGIDVSSASISPYWRRNHTDEAWRNAKRQWLADQQKDT